MYSAYIWFLAHSFICTIIICRCASCIHNEWAKAHIWHICRDFWRAESAGKVRVGRYVGRWRDCCRERMASTSSSRRVDGTRNFSVSASCEGVRLAVRWMRQEDGGAWPSVLVVGGRRPPNAPASTRLSSRGNRCLSVSMSVSAAFTLGAYVALITINCRAPWPKTRTRSSSRAWWSRGRRTRSGSPRSTTNNDGLCSPNTSSLITMEIPQRYVDFVKIYHFSPFCELLFIFLNFWLLCT